MQIWRVEQKIYEIGWKVNDVKHAQPDETVAIKLKYKGKLLLLLLKSMTTNKQIRRFQFL